MNFEYFKSLANILDVFIFFTSITQLLLDNGIEFGQNFQLWSFHPFYMFRGPWIQKSSFWKLVCVYVCVCM